MMLKIIRTTVLCIGSLVVLFGLSFADAPKDPDPAPIPTQILAAKKVFISNGGSAVAIVSTIPQDLPYNEFYAGMKTWGHYELMPSPADADLVLEIRYLAVTAGAEPRIGDRRSHGDPELQLCLRILDPKTRIVLWTLTEHIDSAILDSNKRKNLNAGLAALISDMKRLATQAITQKFPELPGWSFDVDEVSAGVYRVSARDQKGRKVEATGLDPNALIEECKRTATELR